MTYMQGWETSLLDMEIAAAESHDYEPGETTTPMQTDPQCRVCGGAKRSHP